MRIALVFPPSTFLTRTDVWPPLGLFYLAAQIERLGHVTEYFDLSMDAMPEDGEFDQMWISATSPQMFEIRKISKVVEGWSQTRTILGGPAAWVDPEECAKLSFDLVVSGESDHPEVVEQILWMVGNPGHDKVYSPKISPNLDWVLPPVRRWTTRYHAYMKDREGQQHRMTSIFTTRGCPMSCAFCESGRNGVIWDSMVRYEPLEVVEEQIRECRDLGFTGLAYYDDIFILNRKRTQKLLELHRKYGMVFRCFMRSDILVKHGGYNYLQEMVEGGLIEVFVGVESASNTIKDNIHKGTTITQDEMVLEWCKQLGVTCKMSFILGLPGETAETMQETKDWILSHRPTIVQVDRLIPFPGTPLTSRPDEYDLQYDRVPDEEWFFRGRYDQESRSFVSTSQLSVDEIDAFWHDLEKILISEGLSTYGH